LRFSPSGIVKSGKIRSPDLMSVRLVTVDRDIPGVPVFTLPLFLHFFPVRLKQTGGEIHTRYSMRKQRLLVEDAWYGVRTAANNREPVFQRRQAIAIFCRVFGEARERFAFELRGFRFVEERLSFYIRPADGLQLPAIMQWVKQTFAVRFNLSTERTGHVWGDRYWSRVLEGEPPEWAAEVDWKAVAVAAKTGVISFGPWPPDGVSPLTGETPAEGGFSPHNPARPPPPPG
jgi:hypothetical protein